LRDKKSWKTNYCYKTRELQKGRKQANLEKIHIKKYSVHKFLLSVVCNLFIFVCMGFNAIISSFSAISKVVILLRIYLGAITSAFLRSLQATDSFPTFSVVGGK